MFTNIQNHLLQLLCAKKIPITLYLLSGIRLEGSIEKYTESAICLKDAYDRWQQWVNLDFIATLMVSDSHKTTNLS
jgi:RNA chaperone Hfq